MKRMVRAIVTGTAAAVAAALLAANVSRAAECRAGPAVFDAPACGIVEESHFEGPAQYVQWKEGSITYQVTAITPGKRQSFKGYLARWRHSHKCTAEEISLGHQLSVTAPGAAGNETPPQTTWKGVCADCGSFIIRAIRLKRQVVELHAGRGCGGLMPPPPIPTLEQAFETLLDRVRLAPGE
jgi:hypothetical protein